MENNSKRFLSLLLALLMVIGMMPMGHVHAEGETYLLPQKVTSVQAGEQYVICFAGGARGIACVTRGWGNGTGLDSGSISLSAVPDDMYLWTLEDADGGYKIRSVRDNTYVSVSQNNAELNTEGLVFTFTHTSGGFVIKANDIEYGYFNNLGGSNVVGGWNSDGTKFDIYKITEVSDPFGKLRGLWTPYSVSSETPNVGSEGLFSMAFDNNPSTHWHTNWNCAEEDKGKFENFEQFDGVINLGAQYVINRFSFTPRQDGNTGGRVLKADLQVKLNEEDEWITVATDATFADDATEKFFNFDAQTVQYVRFIAKESSASADGHWVAVSEFNVYYDASLECEHSWDEGMVTKEATCGEDGVKTFTCSKCGGTRTETISATGNHTAAEDDGDCTTPISCSVCGQEAVAAKAHVWSEEGVYTAPTTEADGYTTYTCTNEGCNATNVVIDEDSQQDPIVVDPFNKDNWTKINVDSETIKENESANEGEFAQAWDGNTNTKWHSNWRGADGKLGKLKAHGESNAFDVISGEIDFGAEAYINRFSFLPRQDDTGWANGDGVVTKASLYVKDADDTEWKLVAKNVEFAHNQQWKTFEFPAQNVKQVRFEATRSVNDGWVAVSEFDIGYEEAHTYNEEIITQATCNQPGLKRLTCSNGINGADCTCHHTYTVELPATGEHTYENACDADCNVCGEVRTPADHVYDNDTDTDCNVCGAERKVLFDIAYTNMTMGNDLKVHFAFAKDNIKEDGCYAVITSGTKSQTVAAADWKTMTMDGIEYYYATFDGVAAKEMTDDITITIYNAEKEAISNVYTDSIERYALRNLDGDNELYKRVVVDMLNYGTEAQKNAGYNLKNLANAKLTEAQKAYASDDVVYTNQKTNSNPNVKYLANVKMVDNIQFMMAFYGVDDSMTIKVSYQHWNEGKDTVNTFAVSELQKSGSYYVITLEDTVIADGFQTITCEIVDDDNNVVATITDSMASYAARAKENTNSDLYEAIMKFSASAKTYLDAKNNP